MIIFSTKKQLTLNQNFGVVLTMNSYKSSENCHVISPQFRSMFRVVAVIEPDIEMVIRARCIQYGVKAPNILSVRLKLLYDLSQSSLMSLKNKYQITVDSFLAVIRSIYEKQRSDGTSDSRPASFAKDQLSASKYSNPAKLESMFIINKKYMLFSFRSQV